MTTGVTPQDVHRAFEAAFNRQDLEGLVALYTPDAVIARLDGPSSPGSNGEIVHTREYLLVLGTRR